MARTMITTSDNPFNPQTQYDQWRGYDEAICGYFTSQYLDRIIEDSPEFTADELNQAMDDAIDEIIAMDLPLTSPVTGERVHYVKVTVD